MFGRGKWPSWLPFMLAALLSGCDQLRHGVDADSTAALTSSPARAARRLYAGAPPVIPHEPLKIACGECHTRTGKAAPPLGMAPANPHAQTPGLGETANCVQCHVFRQDSPPLAENEFVGIRQSLEPGGRLYRGAPPVAPHRIFMREDCAACHTGPAARPEIRCSHPERANCRQCHVPAQALVEEPSLSLSLSAGGDES